MKNPRAKRLGLWSGVGLVMANMVGVGVLTTTGYMAKDLGPGAILAAWLVGGVAAMSGALAYAALAALIPRSGGEYRYLSDLLHPAVGCLAGWTSLLVGFSAPIALAASAAGSFTTTLVPGVDPRVAGAAIILGLTALHALDLGWSRRTQDVLALAKVILLLGFVGVGLWAGNHHWPTWRPSVAAVAAPVAPFMISLVFIAYAYTGWNTAVYAAEEFEDPQRTVPRALLIGTALVTVLYLIVNWVFVANLSSERLAAWTRGDTDRITVGHLLVAQLAGPGAARAMSALVILALISLISAMVVVGPRVCGAMAREGFLPRALAGRDGKPPAGSVYLQSAIALALLLTHSFDLLVRNVGAILTFTSALTVLALFRVQFGRTPHRKPGAVPLVAAGIFVSLSSWMLYFAVRDSPTTILWVAATVVLALGGYFATRSLRAAPRDG